MLSQLRTLLVHQDGLKWGGSERTNIVLAEQSYELTTKSEQEMCQANSPFPSRWCQRHTVVSFVLRG